MATWIVEDNQVASLDPVALTRPVFDLRCGVLSLLERQLRTVPSERAAVQVRDWLGPVTKEHHPELTLSDNIPPGVTTVINARWVPSAGFVFHDAAPHVGIIGEDWAYLRLPADGRHGSIATENIEALARRLPARPAAGWLVEQLWDLIAINEDLLAVDATVFRHGHSLAAVPKGVHVIGPADDALIDAEARVEPGVVLDTRKGPVMIDSGATVAVGSTIEGPCYIGRDSRVARGYVRSSSIGPHCRIGGEVESTIFQGFANKYHDGFIGHSYVGEWVNIGAGTQISDLRNDYGEIHMFRNGKKVGTGSRKLGVFLGDHTKTSIGCLINSGTSIGAFCNLVANGRFVPRVVPSFCRYRYDRLYDENDLRLLFETARIVMDRRGRQWSKATQDMFFLLYEQTAEERRRLLQQHEVRLLRRIV